MSFFDLDPTQTQNLLDHAALNPIQPDDLKPGWYAGMATAPLTGVASAVNDAALLLGDAATPTLRNLAQPIDKMFNTHIDDFLKGEQQKNVDNIRALTPDPRTTGMLGNITHGLFNVVPEAVLGGPETAGALQGYKAFRGGMEDGLDPTTAFGMGAINGISTWVGMKIPMSFPGFGLAKNVGLGIAANVPTGMATRGATGAFLDARGYPDMAAQYKVLDSSAIAADVIMGGAFGMLGHYTPAIEAKIKAWQEGNSGKILPSDVDTALTLKNQQHIELDTAPGVPATPEARVAHVETLEKSLKSLLDGDPVRVDDSVTQQNFIEDPNATAYRESVVHVVEEHMGADWSALQRELEARGLPTDEVDSSSIYKVATVPARIQSEIPHAVMGDEASVKISGTYHPVRWALVDAANVEATMAKADNQFRDRGRAASQAQVSKIANEPDFNLLNHSPIMDFGAPTLTRDGKIVGGNGRFAGVSQAYEKGSGEGYRKPLIENLQHFGIDPARAEGMKKPVLVRVLQSDVDVQKAAMASNEGAGLRMSALEQAKVDGIRLGSIAGLNVGENGELNSPANRGYIKQWVREFPTTEAAALVDKDGQLSVEGSTRLRNAILYRAFGDSPTLERLVESTDPGSKNVATALLRTAATIAEVKDAIEKGELHPLDISQDISQAIETFANLRMNGEKVADYLAQGQFFGAELSPIGRRLLQYIDTNIRSAKNLTSLIDNYYSELKKAGDPRQSDMLGGTEVPTKEHLFDKALEETKQTQDASIGQLPFSEDIGAKLENRIKGDFTGAAKEYSSLEDSNGGQILNTDVARELSPEYRADRTRSADVHEAASQFIKDLYAKKLAEPTPEGKLPKVLFTGGGTGAGKSTGLKLLGDTVKQAEIIYDTNMNKLESADTKIQQALDAGRDVTIVYTFRDPMEALTSGALPRAMRMGRTVPLSEHAKTHVGAREVVDQLAEKYKDNPKVNIVAIDNSRGMNNAAVVPLAKISSIDHIGLEGRLYEATKAEHAAGKISDAVYRGTTGEDVPRGMVSEGSGRTGEQPKQGSGGRAPEGSSGQSDPYSAAAVIESKPDLQIASENGDAVPAQKAIADADAEIEIAKQNSQGYDAAVACALRG